MGTLFQTEAIFHSLVLEMNKLINEDVIITNEVGNIVASTEAKRIGDYHEGAYLAMKNRVSMVMTKELSETLQGVRRGIVLPIIIEDRPIGVLGITGNPDVVEPYAQIVQKMAELFIKSSSDQMTQEKMARNLELFVFDWLNEIIKGDTLLARGEFFQLPIESYRQVISIHLPDATSQLSYKDIIELRIAWDRKEQAIFVRWGEGKLLIIDQQYEKDILLRKIQGFQTNMVAIIGADVYVGIGQPADYQFMHQSLEQAERACAIAQKENRIIFEDELRFEMIQHEINVQTKWKFIERTIAPIREEPVLLDTLTSWFDHDMSIQETAATLHIHKNTLYYRLEKIEKRTHLSVNVIEDMMLLYIGSRFLQEIADLNKE